MSKPVKFVALVGRSNVGKSTLFNALTRTRQAIIHDTPGVTRDRIYGEVTEDGQYLFSVIDTGGFQRAHAAEATNFFSELTWQQTQYALDECDLIVLVFDARIGPVAEDKVLIEQIRKHHAEKPIIYVANKVDGLEQEHLAWAFYELGIAQDIIPLSAAHRFGVASLREKIMSVLNSSLSNQVSDFEETPQISAAIIGRPNVGKSSLLNRLLNQPRSLVSPVQGTTRDTIEGRICYDGHKISFIDTAGIRRRGKIHDGLEHISIIKSMSAIKAADICLLVLDAKEGLTDQDARLANLVLTNKKPLIIVVNKWDEITPKTANTLTNYEKNLRLKLTTLDFVPIRFISCTKNQRVFQLPQLIVELMNQANRRVPTSQLNDVLQRIVAEHTPALIFNHRKRVKFYYAAQINARPPTFVVKCNFAHELQESYKRYLKRRLQNELGFNHIPVHLVFRGKSEENKFNKPFKKEDSSYEIHEHKL